MTIITAILPFLAALNAIYYPRLVRAANTTSRRKFLGVTLQVLQAILTTVLATLFLSHVVPSPIRKCILSTTWQRLFSAHDAESIRRVQDALNCCGFNTVRDRAWPFPNNERSTQCYEMYGRTTPCSEPWRMALQRNAGLESGIVLIVAVSQVSYSEFPWRRDWKGFHAVNETTQIVMLVLVEVFGSFDKTPHGRAFRYGAASDPERARLLPGDDQAENGPEGARLLPAGEPPNLERREPRSGRGADPLGGNPWEGA